MPHDVLKEHLSSLWIQQCMRQLFKVDTVTISTTTSRSLNRLYVTTFKLTRSPSVQRRPGGGGTLETSGWGCAAGTLEPLTYTRAKFS